MSTLRLTDISSAQSTALTPTTLIHIVTTADTTQFSGGSSYKASLSQVFDSLSAYTIPNLTVNTFSSDTISATTIDLCGTNGTLYTDSISGCSPINFLSESNFVSGLTATTVSATTYENLPVSGVTSTGTGVSLISSIVDGDVRIKSISGNTLGKISADTISETVELDVVEPNLDLWSLVVQGNRLLYGEVSYVSGLTFEITNLKYIINGDIYTSSGGTIVLPSGSTDDRIDVIYADTSSLIGSISGTPSPNPEKPVVDGASQVEVTFVNVPASASSLNFSGYVIYNENVGPPSEWTFGSGGVQPTRIIGNNTTIAYTGTTSIRVSAVTSPSYQTYFRLTGSTAFDTNDYAVLQFAIRNLVSNSTSNRIQLRFLTTGGTQNGNSVLMNALGGVGYVQYSSTNTSSWQLISIPLWRFYLTNTNVQVLEVSFWPIGGSVQSNYYFDYFEFRKGSSSSPPTNSWTTIRGDLATPSITATNPNSTLIISGGTNIGSTVTSPNRVNINLDNYITLSGVTATTIGASGNCVNDLYVNNIHSCSPLNINPLNEGNVYFGSTSAVTIDLSNNRVGIGTSTPSVKLQVKGIDDTSGNTSFLVETSGSTPLFSIRNDGFSSVYNANQLFGENLAVNGTVRASNSGYLITDSADYWQIYGTSKIFGIRNSALAGFPILGIDVNNPYYVFTHPAYNLGVGISTPTAKLHVNNTSSSNTVLFEDDTNPDSTPFVITNDGSVGVGITSPTSKLHIETTGTTDPFKITASSVGLANINYNGTGIAIGNGANYTLATIPNYSRAMSLGFLATSSTPDDEVSTAVGHYTTANANRGSLALGNSAISSGYYTASIGNQVSATGTYSMMIGLGMSNWGNYPINNNVNYSIAFGVANDVPTMWIVNPSPGLTGSTNNVGIGTSAPTEKLEISGKTKTTSLQVTSGATTGYVLTSSDNNGNATWSPVSGITGVVNKYTISTGFTANETKTITHSLNTKFVHCSVWDAGTEQLITAQVVRTLGNINDAVDITIATAGTYDILITG